jgi:hypothetical protein
MSSVSEWPNARNSNLGKMLLQCSHPLHKTIHHPLLAGLVERDGEPVAVDGGDVAVAEFLVKTRPPIEKSETVPVDLATSTPR